METLANLNAQMVAGQLLLGSINGAFYATLSIGLSVVFGLLGLVNFMHGVMYMLGAFGAWLLLDRLGLGYAWALVFVPIAMAMLALPLERFVLRRLYQTDHLVGLLVTLGLGMVVEAVFRNIFSASGRPYPNPMPGGLELGDFFLPYYRLWVIAAAAAACLGTWALAEKTRFGAQLRAAMEKSDIVQALGVDVPRLRALTFAGGAALAAFAGVLAAPIYQVSPSMGNGLLVIAFAVVVIGGMGSILGSIVIGFVLGIAESMVKLVYPQAAATTIFVVMIAVLLFRPRGLFGR